MAGVDASKVLVGAPDQSGASGAVKWGDVGSTLPKSARDTVDLSFNSGGYVSSDGVVITPSLSTTNVTEWGGATVRKLLESFDGTVQLSFIQMSKDEASAVFGEGNVTETAATASSGTQLKIGIGAHLPERHAWVFAMKDGKALIKVVLPDAQVTEWAEIAFVPNSPIPLPATISCYPDASGNALYIMTDDGVFSA